MKIHDKLISVLTEIDDQATMTSLLEEILTPTEINDLSLRWELMQMLQAGVPQRQIAKALGISLCKITRGAKILKDEDSVVRRFLEQRD